MPLPSISPSWFSQNASVQNCGLFETFLLRQLLESSPSQETINHRLIHFMRCHETSGPFLVCRSTCWTACCAPTSDQRRSPLDTHRCGLFPGNLLAPFAPSQKANKPSEKPTKMTQRKSWLISGVFCSINPTCVDAVYRALRCLQTMFKFKLFLCQFSCLSAKNSVWLTLAAFFAIVGSFAQFATKSISINKSQPRLTIRSVVKMPPRNAGLKRIPRFVVVQFPFFGWSNPSTLHGRPWTSPCSSCVSEGHNLRVAELYSPSLFFATGNPTESQTNASLCWASEVKAWSPPRFVWIESGEAEKLKRSCVYIYIHYLQ